MSPIRRFSSRATLSSIQAIDSVGLLERFQPNYNNRLVILSFHRIYQGSKRQLSSYAFDERLFGINLSEFEEIVIWLKKKFEIISEEELAELILGNRPFKGLKVMLSFDDGYRDNFEIAFSLLRNLRVPASFFITTQNIEDRTLFWWDWIAYLVKKCEKSSFYFSNQTHLCSTNDQKNRALRRIIKQVKTLTHEGATHSNLESHIKSLSLATEVLPPIKDDQDTELMTWDQLKEIANHSHLGFSVGSHSHTHPILGFLDYESQQNEIKLSKRILEQKLQTPIRSLAYPVGYSYHFNSLTQQILNSEGYLMAYSNHSGINTAPFRNRYNLLRIPCVSPLPKLKLAFNLLNYQIC